MTWNVTQSGMRSHAFPQALGRWNATGVSGAHSHTFYWIDALYPHHCSLSVSSETLDFKGKNSPAI